MGDIRIGVTGDSTSATKAMKEVGDATNTLHKQATSQGEAQRKQSEEMWKSIGQWAAAGAAAVAAFGVSSVKAFMEADRASRQLQRAAGDATEALEAQAAAMQEIYAVDDDVIKQSQTLLVQWNGIGAASEDATMAILNYAAATGKDAVAATQDLIRNVESGGVGLAKMGVHFEVTGDKATDLKNAVAALNDKFGGAAEADANSLHGNLMSLSLAFEDFQEHVGKAISDFNSQYAITTKLTEALKGLDTFLFGNDRDKRDQDYVEQLENLSGRIEHRKQLAVDLAAAEKAGRADAVADTERMIASNEKAISQLREMLALRTQGIYAVPGAEGGATKKGLSMEARAAAADARAAAKEEKHALDEARKQSIEDGKEFVKLEKEGQELAARDSIEVEKERVAAMKQLADDEFEMHRAARKAEADATEGEDKAAQDSWKAQRDAEKKSLEERLKDEADLEKKSAHDRNERMKKEKHEAAQAADQIGAAFVGALADQLSKLAAGGEFDPAIFIGEVLAATVGTAITVIGTAYGAPAVGAAFGNLAAMGIRAGASGISQGNKKGKYHDGGWIDAPRYHQGGPIGSDERPIIAQTGEFMMSREMVRNAGGPRAMESIARGGGRGVTVHIQAIDAKSAAESFETELGRGMRRSLNSGRGDLPALLGMGPR